MQSRIPRCKASCNRKEEGPPQHDSTISNVQDAFSSLMDSGDSPCSVQQSIAVSSSAESVEKRPASKLAPSRSGRDTHVKWAVNQFYDAESLTPVSQGKVTTRSTEYAAPTPEGTFNFKSYHEFTPPASIVHRKPAKQRAGRMRPATESEKAEEIAHLVYAAPPRPPRLPAATLNSTPPDAGANSPASLSGQSCLDAHRTPARRPEAVLKSLLQERSQIVIDERKDTSDATPSVLKNLLCTATSANFTSATDAAYERLVCPTVGASSVLKQSIDSWAAGEHSISGDGALPQFMAPVNCTDGEQENPTTLSEYCTSKANANISEEACSQKLDTESDQPCRLPKCAVTPKPVPVLASTPEDVTLSKDGESVPNMVQAEHSDSHSPSDSNAGGHVGSGMDNVPRGSTPGSWLLQLGAQTVVNESIESTVLPELSAEQWQAHVPADTPTSRSDAIPATAVGAAHAPAASDTTSKASEDVGDTLKTPRLSLVTPNANKIIQVQSGGVQQVEPLPHTSRQGVSAPPKLAKPKLPANPGCAVSSAALQPPKHTLSEAAEAQAPEEVELVARASCVLDANVAVDTVCTSPAARDDSRPERESAEHPLLRRSITDIVTHIGGNLDDLQPCLRNTISDASPIDLNPQISCITAQMPIFTSPVPHGQQASVQPDICEQKAELTQRETTSIPVRASAPDSPCSRSLKKSAEDGAACHIPKPAPPIFQSQGSSPRHPPAPRLPLVRSALSPCSPRPAHAPPPFSPDVVSFKRTRSMSSSPYTPPSSAPCNKKATQGRCAASPVLSPGALSRPSASSRPASLGSSEAKSPIARLRSLVPSSPSPHSSPCVPSRHILPLSIALSQGTPNKSSEMPAAGGDAVQKEGIDGERSHCSLHDGSPDSHKENCGVLPISPVIDEADTKPVDPIPDHSPLIQGHTVRNVYIPALKLHQAADIFGDDDEDAIVPDTERGVRWSLRTPPKCDALSREPSVLASPRVLSREQVGTPATNRRGTASRSIHASPSPLPQCGTEVKPSPKPIHVLSPLHVDSASQKAGTHHSSGDAAVQGDAQGVLHRLSVRTPFVEALKRMHEPHAASPPPPAPATSQQPKPLAFEGWDAQAFMDVFVSLHENFKCILFELRHPVVPWEAVVLLVLAVGWALINIRLGIHARVVSQIYHVTAVSNVPVNEAVPLVTLSEESDEGEGSGEAEADIEVPVVPSEGIHPQPILEEVSSGEHDQDHVLHEVESDDTSWAGTEEELRQGQGDISSGEQNLDASGTQTMGNMGNEVSADDHIVVQEDQLHSADNVERQSLPEPTGDSSSSEATIDASIDDTVSLGSEPQPDVSNDMDMDFSSQVETRLLPEAEVPGSTKSTDREEYSDAAHPSDAYEGTSDHSPAGILVVDNSEGGPLPDSLSTLPFKDEGDSEVEDGTMLALPDFDEPQEMETSSGMELEYSHQDSRLADDVVILQAPPPTVNSDEVVAFSAVIHVPDSQSSDLSTSIHKLEESGDAGPLSPAIEHQSSPSSIPQHSVAVPVDGDREGLDSVPTPDTVDDATNLVPGDSKSPLSSEAVDSMMQASPGDSQNVSSAQHGDDVGTCPCEDVRRSTAPVTHNEPAVIRETAFTSAAKRAINQNSKPSIWFSCLWALQSVVSLVTLLGLVFLTDVRLLLPTGWLEFVEAQVLEQMQRTRSFIKNTCDRTPVSAQAASSVTPEILPQMLHVEDDAQVVAGQDAQPGTFTRRRAQSTAYSVASDRDLSTIRPERYSVLQGRSIIPERELRAARRRG